MTQKKEWLKKEGRFGYLPLEHNFSGGNDLPSCLDACKDIYTNSTAGLLLMNQTNLERFTSLSSQLNSGFSGKFCQRVALPPMLLRLSVQKFSSLSRMLSTLGSTTTQE